MAVDERRNQKAARFLFDAHAAREPYQPIPDGFAPRTISEAYDMQDIYTRLMTDVLGPIIGYKVALTTPVMQRIVGFNEPCAGVVFGNGVHRSPETIKSNEYVRLGAECEVAVLLKRDLPTSSAPYDQTRVRRGRSPDARV